MRNNVNYLGKLNAVSFAALVFGLAALGLGLGACTGPAGDDGPIGPSGTNCTVTDNGDGSSTISCEDGTTATVSNGQPGQAGSACWDLDGNGSCDVASEDIDGDGGCTVADCAGQSLGLIAGTVTNSLSGAAVSGATVTLDPDVGIAISTDNNGAYSAELPVGSYSLTFEKGYFTSAMEKISIVAGGALVRDVALVPEGPVIVSAGGDQTGAVGGDVTLMGTVEIMDGSTISGYAWTRSGGEAPDAVIDGEDTDTATVTLAGMPEYKAALAELLMVPDRLMVLGINPHALAEVEMAEYQLSVTTSSGVYTDSVDVTVALPFKVNPGIRNVPLDVPVLVQSVGAASYNWSLTAKPSGSAASVNDATLVIPDFTPDVAGQYTLTDSVSGDSLDIFAGTWQGGITGMDANGRPEAGACTSCHKPGGAPDKFDEWKETGHAEIFTNNLNAGGHYGESCLVCHTVGYNTEAVNGGVDDASDFSDFLNAGLLGHAGADNWATVLNDYPNTAKLANIQCENCHGPNNSDLHMNGTTGDSERVSISADVCGSCHGEPARHGRFQQWQRSGHANFDLSIEQATVEGRGSMAGHCGRCHSGQGFLAWIDQGDLTKWIQGAGGNATVQELADLGMTDASVQPQTCTVCHDPHDEGSATGEPNNANVRISGSTPMLPAGFAAIGVGRGAICMTCHNTRNGAHNDTAGDPGDFSAPHTPSQTDVLMGQNAYFVSVGRRSAHSYLPDSCTNCHMEQTDPPADLSYELGGTNHSFSASLSICANCHGEFDGKGLQDAMQAQLDALGDYIGQQAMDNLNSLSSFWVDVSGTLVQVDLTANTVDTAALTEIHGQEALELSMANQVDLGSGMTNIIDVDLSDLYLDAAGNTLVYGMDGNMTRAAWNYFLLHGDGSEGVHNPGFVQDVINATMIQDLSN